jgi:hypothetical protein
MTYFFLLFLPISSIFNRGGVEMINVDDSQIGGGGGSNNDQNSREWQLRSVASLDARGVVDNAMRQYWSQYDGKATKRLEQLLRNSTDGVYYVRAGPQRDWWQVVVRTPTGPFQFVIAQIAPRRFAILNGPEDASSGLMQLFDSWPKAAFALVQTLGFHPIDTRDTAKFSNVPLTLPDYRDAVRQIGSQMYEEKLQQAHAIANNQSTKKDWIEQIKRGAKSSDTVAKPREVLAPSLSSPENASEVAPTAPSTAVAPAVAPPSPTEAAANAVQVDDQTTTSDIGSDIRDKWSEAKHNMQAWGSEQKQRFDQANSQLQQAGEKVQHDVQAWGNEQKTSLEALGQQIKENVTPIAQQVRDVFDGTHNAQVLQQKKIVSSASAGASL